MSIQRYLIISVSLVLIFISTSCNNTLEKKAKSDYMNNKDVFIEFVLEYKGERGTITRENYNKNSKLLCELFDGLDYEFIRYNENTVFFCKGYDGMSGIGVLYAIDINSAETIKDKIIEKMDDNWAIFSEHYL